MALQKSFTTPYGFECPQAYYRVEELRIDYKNRRADIVLFGYKDATTAQTAKTDSQVRPIQVVPIEVTNGDFTFKRGQAEDVVAIAYSKLKAGDTFTSAVDV